MIDLNHYFSHYSPNLSHHRAAVNALMEAMPEELLNENAAWIDIFEAADSEWGYNKIVDPTLRN